MLQKEKYKEKKFEYELKDDQSLFDEYVYQVKREGI